MALTKASLIDVNGQELILDADADTSITADTDDQIDIKVGGSDTVHMGLTTYNASDRIVLTNTSGNASMAIVAGTSGESSVFMADGTSGDASYRGYVQYQHTNDNMNFGTGGSERLRILGNNLFLTGGTDARIQLGTGGAGAAQVSNNTVHIRGDGTSMKFMAASGGGYNFEINGTEVARIDSNGDMAVGTTDTTSAFTVQQSDNDNPVARFDMSAAVNAIVGMQIRVTDGAANAANKFFIQGLDNTSTLRFEARTNGDVYSSTGSYTSDIRLKENIEDCEPMLEKLKQVRIVDFDWKENAGPEGRQRGVIAQEIEPIFPELIHEPIEYKEFKQSEMVPILVKALQEQQEQIESLQQQIEVLKNGN